MNFNKYFNLKNNYILAIILLLSILSSGFFVFVFDNPIFADARQYEIIALSITNGHYSLDTSVPYSPTMHREPLYPFLLSIIFKIVGYQTFLQAEPFYYNVVYIIQILLFSITCLFTYFISKEIFNKKVATLSGILVSIFPTLANYPSFLLSETLFSFLLIFSIFLLSKSFKLKKTLIFFCSGILLGLVSLTKSVGILFILFVIISMIIKYKKLRKKFFLNLFVLIIGFTTIVFPWSLRNYKTFDTFQISMRGGHALWMAADQLDYTKEQIIQSIVFNFSETIGNKLFPNVFEKIIKENNKLKNIYSADTSSTFILLRNIKSGLRKEDLKELGFLTPESIEKQMRVEATEKILNKPIIFILQRLLEFEKMLAFGYIPSLNQLHVVDYFYNKYDNGDIFLTLLKAPLRLLGYLIFILSVYGIIITRNKINESLFLLLIIIYINLIYTFLFGLGRYAVPLIPFYLIFTSCALINGFNFLNKKNNYKNRIQI